MDFKISVITPSFNSGRYIEKAICSVLDQDYTCYEHIIVDGGSTDNTLDILERYPHLIWVSEKDHGQVHAMNKGFAMATGDIIVYLNADDYFLCGAFSSVIPLFQKDHKFVVGDIIIQKPNEYFVNVPKVRLWEMIRHWEMNAFPYNPIGYFYRKEVQESTPFDEDFPNMMDLRFLLESATKYEFKKINSLLGVYRCLEDTKTLIDQKTTDYWTVENFSFLQKYIERMPADYQLKYEKERKRGYLLQKQWQQQSEGSERQPAFHKPANQSVWSRTKHTLKSKLKSIAGKQQARLPAQSNSKQKPSQGNRKNPQLEHYQQRALDAAMAHMDFSGKNILEIGGDMEFRVAREMVQRGAKQVVSINYSPYFNSKQITDNIKSINMDIRDLDKLQESFDMVFGVAILEHLNNLDVVLRKIYGKLNTDGIVYLHGGPIWTSFLGHHVWIHTDDGCKYEFNNNNPIPDWGHLLFNADEMNSLLIKNGIPEAHSQLIIEYVYASERLSRYTVEDFAGFAENSDFDLLALNNIKWRAPDQQTEQLLHAENNSISEDYSSGEIELILKK